MVAKKKLPRLTFKKSKPGPYHQQTTNIKLDGSLVGTIYPPVSNWVRRDPKWSVMFMLEGAEPSNPNCEWRWVRLKVRFDSEPEARKHIRDNLEKILALNLHFEKDETSHRLSIFAVS